MPATNSILDLAKVLRLPRNSILVKPARGRANGHISEPVPGPFQDRSETVPGPRRRDQGGLRTVRKPNSRTEPMFSASCYPPAPARREWMQHLAKALCLPRNLYLTSRLPRNSNLLKPARGRANVPGPFWDRSEPAPVQASQPGWFAHCPIHAQCQRFCISLSSSWQRMDAAPCECTVPATNSILDLAKVLRLPRNSNLVKPARNRAIGYISEPVRDRSGPFRDPNPPPYRRRG